MEPKWHPRRRHLKWRPPKSDWWSSPLSPNDDDLKQRWHKHYGRLGRRYETRTPEGPSVAEDFGPWEGCYRRDLKKWAFDRAGSRDIADRQIPTFDFRRPYDPETRPGGAVMDVNDFLRRLSGPWPPIDDAGSSSGGAAIASGSAVAEEKETRPSDTVLDVNDFLSRTSRPQPPSDDARASPNEAPTASGSAVAEEEEKRPRYTAAEKGKQREGEPSSSSGTGPSALKPAVPKDPQSMDPGMSTEGLRVPPRHHSPVHGNEEDVPTIEHIEYIEQALSKSAATVRALSKAREAVSKITAGNQLAQARVRRGFAPELPLDGLGVVFDSTRLPGPPVRRSKRPSSSAMKRTQTRIGVPGPSSQAGPVMMERTESQARVPDPNSQEYAHLMAESNRRLEELSPYSPEDKVPDTPKPDLEEGVDDEQPPPSPLLPPTQPHGGVPRPPMPKPYHAPILRAKRNASGISGGPTPGPSSHRQAPAPAAPSATVATMSVNGQERRIS